MKIRINREKYINHKCPGLTKQVMDAFYSNLMMRIRYRVEFKPGEVIDTIDVRVNQAYAGCSKFHFYVSINGNEEVHMSFYTWDQHRWAFDGKVDKAHPRGEWLVDFENHLDVNVGEHKMKEKIKAIWDRRKAKSKTSKRVKYLRQQWEQFLKLNEYFTA